jgi:hypothetical protein
VLPEIEPELALMMVVPVWELVAMPCAPELLLMVATDVLEEVHVTDEVTFCVLPSLKVAVAENPKLVPSAIEGAPGMTAMETRAIEDPVPVRVTFCGLAPPSS